MCPAARCALTTAGHAGPALHGDSALCRWADRVIRPYDGDGKRVRRDGEDAASYGWCTALHGGSALCRWADRVVRPYRWDVEDGVSYGWDGGDGVSYGRYIA